MAKVAVYYRPEYVLRQAQLAQIRKTYPDADEHELKLRLAARWIEPELMKKAFGWDPEKEGY